MSAAPLSLHLRSYSEPSPSGWSLAVHGGAGSVPNDRRALHAAGCRRAAEVGAAILAAGGAALDAVTAMARALEDDPLFNAGTGACLNEDGEIEHDASVMEGTTLRAGAVCALRSFKNPIELARAALEDGRHVLYAAEGARRFALARGFTEVAPESLVTEAARRALEATRRGAAPAGWAGGTIGAVARDREGRVAAATSTGGMVDKRAGRVGDSPLIGAGTYACDEEGAVSTTGHGEGMIRLCIARRATSAMGRGASAADGARESIAALQAKLGSTGGLIAVASDGRLGLAWSTETMSFSVAWGDETGVRGIDAGT